VTESEHPEQEDATRFGDARVGAAVARTEALEDRPVSEHVEVFDDVHRVLRDLLADPDEDPLADGQ
jgi:hypothetical protein